MMDLKLETISGRIEDEPRKFLLGVTRPARRGKLKARERGLRFKAPQSYGDARAWRCDLKATARLSNERS
ncbi:protein of unknown function [Methylocella tundrae]|uniref:Uncharacterized protein n=1 Tax=Methylocella tundrae TaxID=227605 RepID=A0A4U8YWL3_METTU|nr:protein of unknown function [Methylocella tundrae]